jgi:hypothetical protein
MPAFAKYSIGNALSLESGGKPIDVSKFGTEQKAVLRKAMNNAVAAGRDYIKYDDYPLLEGGVKRTPFASFI